MPGVRNPLPIDDLPVLAVPVEIDITTAEQLHAVLLQSAGHGHATIVADMTGTRFCDSAGFNVLVRAHRRALAEGGQLRVVIPADSPVFRVFTLIGLHRLIPWFTSLDQAIAAPPRGQHPRSDRDVAAPSRALPSEAPCPPGPGRVT